MLFDIYDKNCLLLGPPTAGSCRALHGNTAELKASGDSDRLIASRPDQKLSAQCLKTKGKQRKGIFVNVCKKK